MLNLGNKIDEAFRNGLGDMEMEPSPNVWSGIENGLNSNGKKKGLVIMWGVVAAASVLAAVMTTVFLFQDKHSNDLTSSFVEAPKTSIQQNNIDTRIEPFIATEQSNNVSEINDVKEVLSDKLLVASVEDFNDKDNDVVLADSTVADIDKSDDGLTQLNGRGIEEIYNHSEINTKQLKSTGKKEYFPLYAYNDDIKSKNDYQVLLGGAVSSAYNYRHTTGAPVRSYDSYSESGINSMGGGINVRIETNKRWSVETGIVYAQLGQEISNVSNYQSDLMYGDAMIGTSMELPKTYNNSMGKIKFDAKKTASKGGLDYEMVSSIYDMALLSDADGIRQTLEYIEVPLMARYKLIEGFPIISIAGGLSSNILVGNTAYLLDGNSRLEVGETEGIKPISWSSSVGIGFEVPITKMVRISLEPRFKYYIESVNDNPDYNFQPYAFSVFGGITFLLR